MEFGFYLPDSGPLATPDVIAPLAARAEEVGFDILAVSDHIVMPTHIASTYPYEADGEWPGGMDCLETLTTLSFLAASTSKVKLLSSVMVLPYRPPMFTAKMLATIDVLSNGRLIAGLGVGWLKEEFEALQSPPFEERGASSDEYIAVFKELWTSAKPEFDGKYCQFRDVVFQPKPVQTPHPPIWIGGESGPALRRTARVGDVWYPISTNPKFPVVTPDELHASMEKVRAHAERYGRDPSSIGLAYNPSFYQLGETLTNTSGERIPFSGSAAQIAQDIKAFEAVGVKQLMLGLGADSLQGWYSVLDDFMEKVKPISML